MDKQIRRVESAMRCIPDVVSRFGGVLRDTFDQVYDGQRTGRYRWDQLFKTEKTHIGSLFEINLQRKLEFKDGELLDFSIDDVDVDCKFSHSGEWMIPTEAVGEICLVVKASDYESKWSAGLVRCNEDRLRSGKNKDQKRQLTAEAKNQIRWLWKDEPLPKNLLLHLDEETLDAIFEKKSGQARLDQLMRRVQSELISRTTIETVGRQKDPMKRVRANGGSRTRLRGEGIIILGHRHKDVAEDLDLPEPGPSEFVAARVVRAGEADQQSGVAVACIGGEQWRLARAGERIEEAPEI